MLTFVRFPSKHTDQLAFLKRMTNEWEGPIMRFSNSVAVAASSVLALGSVAPAFAHELRILPADHGKISLLVGFHSSSGHYSLDSEHRRSRRRIAIAITPLTEWNKQTTASPAVMLSSGWILFS
jgi:hypothetical protein